MKTLLLCTLLFLTNFTLACGYYPYGEEVRFKLMDPLVFGFRDYQMFNYTGNKLYFDPNAGENYGSSPDSTDFGKIANAKLWALRCNQNVKIDDILSAVYGKEGFSKLKKSNSFIKDLFARNDKEAFAYLEFARKCSVYNTVGNDPWEQNSKSSKATKKMIAEAIKLAEKAKNEEIKNRYYFLAIRMSYYAHDYSNLKTLYNNQFATKVTGKNIIDYWALYFRTIVEEDATLRNYLSAIVFYHAPDKRHMINFQYNKEIDINITLALAKNNLEKEAIYFLDAIKTPGKCLIQIQAIQSLNPNSKNLRFLLLREVNKLEDWILTPSYTRFFPAAGYETYYLENNQDAYLAKRITEDQLYTSEISKVLAKINEKEDLNTVLYLKMYATFLSGNYTECIKINEKLEKECTSKNVLEQAKYIKALALTASQKKETATILNEVEPILEKACLEKNLRFIFALGRELEAKGNTSLAALCYWKLQYIQTDQTIADSTETRPDDLYWKAKKRNRNLYSDYYYEYFHYLDAEYSVQQLNSLISYFENGKKQTEFIQNFAVGFDMELPKMNDLVGTKYMRINELAKAETHFLKAGEGYYEAEVFQTYLGANPFYTNMYNEHSKVAQDSQKYSKITLVKTLQEWIKKSKVENNLSRAEASFTVANCYLNMTQYGNSWMMKRYYWTSNADETQLEDDEEYFKCTKAKEYYLKAASQTNRSKFKALCIRMAGRCEGYKLWRETDFETIIANGEEIDFGQVIFAKNKYYKQIKKEYASSYDDLISNCLSFEEYYTSKN